MQNRMILCAVAAMMVSSPDAARAAPNTPPAAATAAVPVVMEYYYRIKWGSADEFKRLYFRNHAPLLAEMQKAGFIRSVRVEEPFTHMAGGPRWDLRVTIAFRDAAAAIADPEWDRLWEAGRARLFPDKAAFDAEEVRRFTLLDEHWDIVVNNVGH